MAVPLEDEIYTASTCQSNYLRMLDMETKSHTTSMGNPWSSNSILLSNNYKPLDYAPQSLQPQVLNQEPSMFSKPHLPFLDIQNNIVSPSSSSLPSTVPPIPGLASTPTTTMFGQNANIQNISGVPQKPSMDYLLNILYLQQLQQQMICHQQMLEKEKFEYASISHQLMQSQTPQQQHNLMLPNQPESIPHQSIMQPWLPPSILQQPPQPSLMHQQPLQHQQPTMSKQSSLLSQQLPQPWLHEHQSNLSNMESLPSESLMFSGYLPLSDKDLTDPGVRSFPPGSSHGDQSLQCLSCSLHQQPTMSQKMPQPWSYGHQSNLSNTESLPSESLMFSSYLPLSDKDLTDPVVWSPGSSQSRSRLLSDSQYLESIFLLICLLLLWAFLWYHFY